MNKIEKIDKEIQNTREKISEYQGKLRKLEAQRTEAENLEIVNMVKAVKMDNSELTDLLKAYASGQLVLPKNTETEDSEDEE